MTRDDIIRLAEWLERGNYNHEDVTKAAAELRRLHEVNAELLKALRLIVELGNPWNPADPTEEVEVARAAIAKAEDEP